MLTRIALAAMICLASWPSVAATYPAEPVKIVVPYTAGGSVDTVTREIGKKLAVAFDQAFVVENRPGASANIGAAYVARSSPNGYTLFMSAATTMAAAPSIFKNLSYDPLTDLSPVALVASQPNVLVVNPAVKANNAKEFIQFARTKPGGLNVGIVSVGGPQHMSAVLFMSMTNTRFALVPYKGGSDAVVALLGGYIDAIFAPFPEVISYIRAGKLKPLGVTTKERTGLLPQVPSLSEQGLDGFELVGWMGLAAPGGTSAAVISKLNAALQKALKDPEFGKKLNGMGLEPQAGSVDDFIKFRNREMEKYRELVKAAGITPQ